MSVVPSQKKLRQLAQLDRRGCGGLGGYDPALGTGHSTATAKAPTMARADVGDQEA